MLIPPRGYILKPSMVKTQDLRALGSATMISQSFIVIVFLHRSCWVSIPFGFRMPRVFFMPPFNLISKPCPTPMQNCVFFMKGSCNGVFCGRSYSDPLSFYVKSIQLGDCFDQAVLRLELFQCHLCPAPPATARPVRPPRLGRPAKPAKAPSWFQTSHASKTASKLNILIMF